MDKENEEKPAKMFAYGILKVIYSPVEAFKNIVKKPNLRGPLLILLLVSICYVSTVYIRSSKILFLKDDLEVSLVQTDMVGSLLAISVFDAVFVFLFKWGVYAALFMMVMFVFRLGKFSWKDLLIGVGYVFSASIVYYVVSIILISTFQPVSTNIVLPLSNQTMIDKVNDLMWESWSQLPAFYAIYYLGWIVQIWIAVLSGIAIHFLQNFTWKKAAMVSALASFINFFITGALW